VGVVDSALGPDVGEDTETQVLQFGEYFTVTLDRLREAHSATLPALFR
jgi:hypothetical protein